MVYLSEASRRLDAKISPLDLPDALADEAEAEYRRITRWLGDRESPLGGYELDLYPQGSFRLGTPIRPIHHHDEFDIDLVCQVAMKKEQTTQADLKALVGDRLKKDKAGTGKLEERRRCWTLFYPKKFHLDVLPTIPDAEHHGDGILVTDTQLVHWQYSNPLGYANWFYGQMRTRLDEERVALAKSLRVDIEQIPVWRVRTPLQRAVQVLKRHRDIHFVKDLDSRPVSIIITTLAGRSYSGETDLAEALLHIVERMEDHVEERGGKWWVSNPAHEKENFADKWNEKPALRDAFLRWRDQTHEDIEGLSNVANDGEANVILEKSLYGMAASRPLSLTVPAAPAASIPRVADLTHRKRPLWPVRPAYDCTISMRSQVASGAGNWRTGTVNRVPKHAALDFTARTTTPEPYEIWWQVTNTGEEARNANALRGGFERGKGIRGESKSETTLYYGTHLVQAFVVKDNVVVGRSRELNVRIEKN